MKRRPISFVRALVMASGLAGFGACGRAALIDDTPLPTVADAGSSPDAGSTDSGRVDAGIADAGFSCFTCRCGSVDAGPECSAVGLSQCCFAGPLAPPDLPALV